MHGRIQHIQVDRRQTRLDRLELLLARLVNGWRGLRWQRNHAIAMGTHAHQNVPGQPLAIAERYIASGIASGHHCLAMLAQCFSAIPFEQNLHDLGTHW
ncbi:hypothetical protein D3C79_1028290 [compost metagenome]